MTLDLTDVIVAVAAGLAIVGVLWYFLGPRRRTVANVGTEGIQEVTILVQGGYEPSTIEVDAGRPVRLTFDRRENNPCSDEVIVAARGSGVRIYSAAGERQVLDETIASASCALADLNGDKRIDIACIGQASANLKWYENMKSR